MVDESQKGKTVIGVVTEALPDTLFRIKLEEGDSGKAEAPDMLVYLAGKMRLHRIRVLIGDKVKVQLDPYGGRGRIIQRM